MGRIILAVEEDEKVRVGEEIKVSVRNRKGRRLSLIIEAPKSVSIKRNLWRKKNVRENE
ncbi:MAG: carbon storage regulator [Bacteriovoracaceae bacterium]